VQEAVLTPESVRARPEHPPQESQLQIDLVEDTPAASAELADQRGLAHLTRAAQDKRLAPWGNQPFFQPGQRFSLDHVKTDPSFNKSYVQKGVCFVKICLSPRENGQTGSQSRFCQELCAQNFFRMNGQTWPPLPRKSAGSFVHALH
jgi:hypothetical protein